VSMTDFTAASQTASGACSDCKVAFTRVDLLTVVLINLLLLMFLY